ncbi:MAG: MGMT family protein [Candidatus Micrarchaeota archaeon]
MQPLFSRKVLAFVRRIPAGRVSTYGSIARKLGTHAYRAVGAALACNEDLQKTPCYRVVRSDGSLGGYVLGKAEKARRLRRDGIRVSRGKIVDFDKVVYSFK